MHGIAITSIYVSQQQSAKVLTHMPGENEQTLKNFSKDNPLSEFRLKNKILSM